MRALIVLAALPLLAAEHKVDPTFLHRYAQAAREEPSDISTATCHYHPAFGAGDSQANVPRSVARFGEITLDHAGSCEPVTYPAEEQVYLVLDGKGSIAYGEQQVPVRKDDYLYLPPSVRHAASCSPEAAQPPFPGCRIIVMGFKIPAGTRVKPPAKPLIANMEDVNWQTVSGHPDSVLYRLLMGDTKSTRDKIAAGHVLVSLFVMQFVPGGTNAPHHHDQDEEIYLVLDGTGTMVAGGGMDGTEGQHPAHAGEAYFFRLNCTVGFYNSTDRGSEARILAVRSRYPFSKEID
jgi:mannose-6-phosphate isomerase-like protein (cupin superfamily)